MITDPLPENPILILSDAEHQLQAVSGEIILLAGEVGSGKSLWLKRLAGLLDIPSHISASINGKAVHNEVGRVQMLFDHQPPLWLGQSVAEELCFGLKGRIDPERLAELLAEWRLESLDPTSELTSLNRLQAVRLNLAAMALAGPAIALLDNPTDALPEPDVIALRDDVTAWAHRSNTTVVVACNRWHDWQPVATQSWRVTAAEDLPHREGRYE